MRCALDQSAPIAAPLPERWNPHMEQLHIEAFQKFGARCLWNVKGSKSLDGLRVIADALRATGGMDAWRLANEIGDELARATR